jgi:hypothetical protein
MYGFEPKDNFCFNYIIYLRSRDANVSQAILRKSKIHYIGYKRAPLPLDRYSDNDSIDQIIWECSKLSVEKKCGPL